MDTSAYNT